MEKTLDRVPWTARRSNQSTLKVISPGCSLEGMMLKLKFQYFGHLMWRVDSLEKTLMLGGIGGRRKRGWQRMRLAGWHHRLDGREHEWTPGVGDGQGGLACCNSRGCKESDTTEWLNWTERLNWSDGIRDDRIIYSPSPIIRSKSFRKPMFLDCELHTHFSISLPSGGAGRLEWIEVVYFPSSTFKTGAVIVGYFPSPRPVRLW